MLGSRNSCSPSPRGRGRGLGSFCFFTATSIPPRPLPAQAANRSACRFDTASGKRSRPSPTRTSITARSIARSADGAGSCRAAPAHRPQRKRHDHAGQGDVRNQNREVERANPSVAGKTHVANFIVIEQVRGQKYRRDDERADHARAMRTHPSHLDENESRQQQNRGASIKDRVQRRERMIRIQSARHSV